MFPQVTLLSIRGFTIFERTNERLLFSVSPQMVKQIVPLFEALSAAVVVADQQLTPSICLLVVVLEVDEVFAFWDL